MWPLLGGLIGGVGLFLLGMGLMTDGLKLAAGPALERILASSTKTRWRGLASGIAVTALVQSSSAVTVAAIGFVNAGLLNLSQALWVLFGANVGTTMTGWLVALVGLKFKIEALAFPLVGVGMFLRLTGADHKRGALGMAMAGFGVLFIGIDMLKVTFSGVSSDFQLPGGVGSADVLTLVLIGIALTVLMQSSSAALVVALTAAQGGMIGIQGAAAVVIGANVGTTVTALMAAIGATANARRAAAAHIVFNLLTGVVALLLLPWLIDLLSVLREWLGLGQTPAAMLALFHTFFNVLGVVLIWPLGNPLNRFLEARFKRAEEDLNQPRYLDKTILAVPTLALDALAREIRHMGSLALAALRMVITDTRASPELAHARRVVAHTSAAIADFIAQLNRCGMTQDSATRLPELLRLARYYDAAADLAAEAGEAAAEAGDTAPADAVDQDFRHAALKLMATIDPEGPTDANARHAAYVDLQKAYQAVKAFWLESGATGRTKVSDMDARLRAASALRRALEQAFKAVGKLENASHMK